MRERPVSNYPEIIPLSLYQDELIYLYRLLTKERNRVGEIMWENTQNVFDENNSEFYLISGIRYYLIEQLPKEIRKKVKKQVKKEIPSKIKFVD